MPVQTVTPFPDIFSQRAKKTLGQFVRFSLVGSLNTLIDVVLFNLLVWMFPVNNVYLVVALNAIAYSAGALNSFFWNKLWTFKQRSGTTGGQVMRFALVTGLGIVCNSAFLWLATAILNSLSLNGFLWVNVAKVSAIGGSVTVSYLGMRFGVFAKSRARAKWVDSSNLPGEVVQKSKKYFRSGELKLRLFEENNKTNKCSTLMRRVLLALWEGSPVSLQIHLFILLTFRRTRQRAIKANR